LRLCPLCRQDPDVTGSRFTQFSNREFHYGMCRPCDLGLVLDPREDYENLYGEAYYSGRGADPMVDYLREMREPNTIRTLEWRGLARTLGPVNRDLRVLDFGCGLGGLTRFLSQAGWNAVGFEDDGFARQWMRAEGLPIVDHLEPDSFDVIFAIEVVEHLVDPVPVLRLLRSSLKPGGRLIITTGNLAKAKKPLHAWSYASVPEVHVTFWTPHSWSTALRAGGFTSSAHVSALPASITQYKMLKSLPRWVRPLARVAPLWRPVAAVADQRFGVSDFADGLALTSPHHDSPDGYRDTFFAGLQGPPGTDGLPAFDGGWRTGDNGLQSHLSYVDFTGASWSDDLEEIHEESSRDHFMDVLTRDSLLAAVAESVPDTGVVADLGCSTGYLLEDLARAHPRAQLVGVDVVAAGLRKAYLETPQAALLLADVCDLPIGDESVSAVVSANMLEHVADDQQALTEIRRILVPGGLAALVVPFGHNLYDYYDRFLGHERRYRAAELATKAMGAGLEVVRVEHLGQLLYPPFWLVKKRNRMLRERLRGDALRAQVEQDIAGTTNSRLGAMACDVEKRLTRRGIRFPFGIRELVVLRKPAKSR
jgi:2-polyprenyl-3-methyl-5-hydroxy-6-metoxy-1,4-benzoquinol methylase